VYVLGLDVGTTFTAAAVWRDGRAQISSLGTHSTSIPSVLVLREGEFLVGEPAVRRAASEPTQVAREFKRRFGDSTPVLLGGTPYSVEALTARLIRSVVDDVARREGGYPAAVCVSHPANWGPFRVELLRSTLAMVDLQVPVHYVTEPEAAAISFAHDERLAVGEIVAVYDLGGGTFDAAVLRRTADGFEILGHPEGIERLGGVDVDAAVFQHVTGVLRARFDVPGLLEPDEDDVSWVTAMARLRQECVAAKEALSADGDVSVPVFLPGLTTEVRMTRAELEGLIAPALHDSVAALRRALRSAGVPAEEVSAVLLVGGSSRIPLVGQLVSAELGRPVVVDAHPKHGVALGAAWVASREALAGSVPEALAPVAAPEPEPTPTPTLVEPPVAAPPAPAPVWPPVALPPREPQPAPVPVAPVPIPVAPIPVAPIPVAPIPVAPIPVAPIPVAPVPAAGEGSAPRRSGARRKALVPLGLVAATLTAALVWQFTRDTGEADAAGTATPSGASGASVAAPPAAVTGRTVIISSDLPLQGPSKPVSEATNAAIELYLTSVGHKAGPHTVTFTKYDDSTAAASRWDAGQCLKNATAHVRNANEVAVVGAYNAGCTKIIVPVLGKAPDGPMLMVSHATTDPGLTKAWETGEPATFYPGGARNFARVVVPDDVQGAAASDFLRHDLGVQRVFVLDDAETYGRGLARRFEASARAAGVTVVGNAAWDPTATSYGALFEKVKAAGADAVYLAGTFDDNGAQLVKDKVVALGDNSGVRLIAPDGFVGRPELTALPEAEGMYLTVPYLSSDLLQQRKGPGTAKLLDAYRAAYSADASPEALYGVAALQVVLAAIAASDGTRKGVTAAVLGGAGITVPADVSVLGKDITIDPRTGDVNLQDVTVEVVKDGAEVTLQAVSVH